MNDKQEKIIKHDIREVKIGQECIGRVGIGTINLGGGIKGTHGEHDGIGYWIIEKDFKVS